MKGISYRLEQKITENTTFEQNVLLGSLNKKEQLEILLNKGFYHIPYQSNILNHELEYIAIYQSEKMFGESDCGVHYYGRIKNMDIKRRSKINISTVKNPDKNYIVFYVDEWEKLKETIKPEGYGVIGSHIYTNIMLLEKARTIPELSIKTLEEWRTWLELKRIQTDVKIMLVDDNINFDTLVKGFQLKDIFVRIKDGNIIIEKDNIIKDFSKNDFLNNLRGVIKELYKGK